MKVLLDTHTIVWWLGADPRLSTSAREAIARAGSTALVSAASIWEASIKRASGKLIGPDLLDAARRAGFTFLAINEVHANLAGKLPLLHRDPFDRILIAQAMIEGAALVSVDSAIKQYDVPMIW